jgi:hypothetical protein
MVEGSREPNVLVAGKRFHRGVQAAYVAGLLGVEPARAVEQTIERHSGKRLRADILLIVATEPERTQFVAVLRLDVAVGPAGPPLAARTVRGPRARQSR